MNIQNIYFDSLYRHALTGIKTVKEIPRPGPCSSGNLLTDVKNALSYKNYQVKKKQTAKKHGLLPHVGKGSKW